MSEQAQNPLYLLTIWYRPAQTVRDLITSGRGQGLAIVIAAVFGALQMGRFYALLEAGSVLPLALSGVLAGVFLLYFVAMLARNFARWFGGAAELKAVRTALGLSLLPWTLVSAWMCYLLLSGQSPESAEQFYLIFIVLFIYGYVMMLLAMSAALNLSALRTFACLALAAVAAFFILNMLLMLAMSLLGIEPPVAPAS